MANTFNVDELIIDHVLSGTMFDKSTGAPKFCLTLIEEPTLELGGEKVYADDPLGQHIAAFNRSKTATFSGSNSLFSLGLMAEQVGADKKVGTSESKIQVMRREQLQVAGGKVTLKDTPVTGTISIGKMNASKSLTGEYIKIGTASSAGEASVSAKVITMPTSVVSDGDFVCVYYKTEMDKAVQITNAADAVTSAGEFWIEVLFSDKCNQALQYYGFIVFPNAVLDNNASINMTTDGKHPFSLEAMVDYCGTNQNLFYIVVPDNDAA